MLAYRNAAKAVRDAPVSVARLTREGRVTTLPGIGKTLEEKIVALLETGTIPALEKLRAKFPPGLVDMTRLPGLGPKRAQKLFDELGIDSLDALRAAAEGEQLRGVRGFGPKFEEPVLAAFAAGIAEKPAPRVPAAQGAAASPSRSSTALRAHPAAERVELAGSARRLADSVKDLDIIATASDPAALTRGVRRARRHRVGRRRPARTPRAGARTRGLAVDLRVVEPDQFGNLLQHFTGSKAHNIALREAAVRRGLHVSEYGILDDATGETTPLRDRGGGLRAPRHAVDPARAARGPRRARGRRERRLPAADRGGRPARRRALPHRRLRRAQHDRGDGRARRSTRGYEYLAHTDHSATHGFGNHVTPDELRAPDRARARGRTSASTASSCSSGPRRTSSPTARPTTTTTCSPSSTGSSARCTPRSAWPRRR